MRLLFLVPSQQHKTTAGARIRYERLGSVKELFDVSLESLEDCNVDALKNSDICVLSKTYSMEAIAAARELRAAGKVVGIDLFDDYFTQTWDSRLLRFRQWLTVAGKSVDFAICSTGTMVDIVRHCAPDLPVHLVPDPYPPMDTAFLGNALETKLSKARRQKVLELLWFGIGANPFFSVGLRDLVAFAHSLRSFQSSDFETRLTVLTNKPAMTPDNLARLSKIPFEVDLRLWSIEAEQAALSKALVSFIPVNGQSFSRAKSLNRAVTALSAGNQVLSPGFPLYRDLEPAIYVDGTELISDIATGKCRVRRGNLREVSAVVGRLSDLGVVTRELHDFLLARIAHRDAGKAAPKSRSTPALRDNVRTKTALIYSDQQNRKLAVAAKAIGALSVKSPVASIERAYDIRVEYRGGREVEVWLTPPMRIYLSDELSKKCSKPERCGKLMMVKVDAPDRTVLEHPPSFEMHDKRVILTESEPYRRFLRNIQTICRSLFPGVTFFLSDLSQHGGGSNSRISLTGGR